MDPVTSQRHAEPYISPSTELWPKKRRLGFGVVAAIPLLLLTTTFLLWFLSAAGVSFADGLVPVAFYVHVGAQFITLLIFGHLMTAHPHLSPATKLIWAVAFLFLAPFSVPAYWALHVWQEEPTALAETQRSASRREIHVYDYDMEGKEPRGLERREDGAIVHHLDPSEG